MRRMVGNAGIWRNILGSNIAWRLCLIAMMLWVVKVGCEGDVGSGFCGELIASLGYPCEERQVTTDDGYILAVQRIPHGIKGSGVANAISTKKPVFLLHGLLQGGETWVLNSPQQSLGFILADAGYDVWIGNLRGSQWSSKHVSFNNQDKSYWNWSWDEHMAYDLPAMLKLVFETTRMPSKYVGYSQGTLIFLASLSQSWVTQFVDAAALLSPIAYLNNVASLLVSSAAKYYFDQIVLDAGVNQIGTTSGPGMELLLNFCTMEALDCSNLLTVITGPNCCINSSRIEYYENYEPQSTSTKNFAHLAQMVRSGKFCKYDYGVTKNMMRYQQDDPPNYDLSKIPNDFSLLLAYGGSDSMADLIDVKHLILELPCHYEELYLPNYAHMDFTLGTSANKDIFDPIVSFFQGKEL